MEGFKHLDLQQVYTYYKTFLILNCVKITNVGVTLINYAFISGSNFYMINLGLCCYNCSVRNLRNLEHLSFIMTARRNSKFIVSSKSARWPYS